MNSTIFGSNQSFCQSFLVLPGEEFFVVFNETVEVMPNCIGRIRKYKIIGLRLVYKNLKICRTNISTFK